MHGANNVVLHDLNMNSIFRTIQHQGPISRVDIAEQTGLAASTVSIITGELQESEFIRECGYATSTGGRRKRLLEVNPEGGHFVCVDMAGAKIAIGLLNLSFQVVDEWFYEKTMVSGQSLYEELVRAIADVLHKCNENTFRILSIGVAAPGIMDSSTGKIVEASNLNWHDLKLNELLEQEFNLPVTVENDTNAAAYGEFLYGSENIGNARNMLYIAIGTGVGAGLIIDKVLYKGSLGMAGEIGHILVRENGQRCSCGKNGCLETVVSEPAILRAYNGRATVPIKSIDDLTRQAESGDAVAEDVLSSAGHTLGIVVGNQVNVLNVDSVVFGGHSVTRGHVMFESILEGLRESLLPGFESNMEARISSLNSTAGYVGVAYLSLMSVLDKYGFKHPAIVEGRKLDS